MGKRRCLYISLNQFGFLLVAVKSGAGHHIKMLKSAISVVFGLMLAAIAQAGYVDFYKDADFENKIGRIDKVVVDVCYNLVCDNLRNTITSARWGGLQDTGVMFERGPNVIAFHTDKNCKDKDYWWPVRTQSDDDLYFPLNFKIDGINDAIQSFRVLDAGEIKRYSNVCTESAEIIKASSDGKTASSNYTVRSL